jgi:hypothetical protein
MGTIIDYAYQFKGTPRAIASARAAIAAFQAENADVSGNGVCDFDAQPKRLKDGSLSWACYAKGDMDDFEESIAELTRRSDLRCLAYWGCTDGQCSSGLNHVARGEWEKLGQWAAEIGIEAALAIVRLSADASADAHAEAALALVGALRVACHDGWDEEDFPWLLKAGVVGAAISAALSSRQDLIEDARVIKALLQVKDALADARDDLYEYRAGRAADRRGVAHLLSTVEALEIAQAVPASKPRARRAMAL